MMEYYTVIKKSKAMLFAATWVDPEIVILSEVKLREDDITSIWNLKKGTDELTYKTEVVSYVKNRFIVTRA